MPRLTVDPITGRTIHPKDDYDYVVDKWRNDRNRHLPNDTASVGARQKEANDRGEPYFPTPWECVHLGKWWEVPEEEQVELMEAETARLPGQEIIETKLANSPDLFRGSPGQVPTPWDGNISESTNWGNIVTNTRIGVQWLRLQPGELGRGSGTTKTIGLVMRRLGWTMRKQRVLGMDVTPYVWVKPDYSVPTNSENDRNNGVWLEQNDEDAGIVQQTTSTDDDDIPF